MIKLNSYLSLFFSIIFLSSIIPSYSQQQIKIGSVEMKKAFDEYYKTKKAQAELNDRMAIVQKEMKEAEQEIKKLKEEGEKLVTESENPALDESKREEKRKLVQTRRMEFNLKLQQHQETFGARKKELEDQQNRMRTTIVDEILKVVQDKAKRDGYLLIIDETGVTTSGVSPFLFVQDSIDITADIIKILNSSAPTGSTAAPPTTTAPATTDKGKK